VVVGQICVVVVVVETGGGGYKMGSGVYKRAVGLKTSGGGGGGCKKIRVSHSV
jgi:hypothetical protein